METQKKSKAIQTADKYIVRLPDGMRDRIAEAARANNRSMNAEIVARLEESFAKPNAVSTSHTELLSEIAKLLKDQEIKLLDELPAQLAERLGKESKERQGTEK
ncbi:MAG: Arc family DNA-binding protein [Candidatus Bathyarchaeota archaeon]